MSKGQSSNPQHISVEPEALRLVMRQWTTGVTIVSAKVGKEQHGMTVSSFTSISLDPPLVAVSLARDSRTYRLIESSDVFGVTILRDDQQELSDRFSGRIADNQDRFSGLDSFNLTTGVSFIHGGLAWLDCQVVSKLDSGNTTVFLGEVVATRLGDGGAPLLYYDRDYHNLCE
jgi:flavin reductase (DIM6/NTAB) family NADH-FMN oxidoreductase RutF